MSHSKRAIERRKKRNKLTKDQRSLMGRQHFGNKYVYQGRPLMRGQKKKELMDADKAPYPWPRRD